MRSLLFVPGDSERKIAKALASSADLVIFDLEDSVAPDAKDTARETVREQLLGLGDRERADGPALCVRVNALDTGLTDADLARIVGARPDSIMQPKTRSGADVAVLSTRINGLEQTAGLEAGAISVIAVATETAAAMFNLGTYDQAGARLTAMTWGAEDLSADIGATTNKDANGVYTGPYQLARTLCLLGAVAAGVDPVDTVNVNFRDPQALRVEAEAAMRDGFTGKMAIHPDQVAIINEVFTPSAEAVERARHIIDAFAAAGDAGVIGLDGEMLDRPHIARAEKLLARAKRHPGNPA